MEPFSFKAVVFGVVIGICFSYRGMKRKSLTTSGAIAAFTVGFLHIVTGLRGFNLLVFYFIGTKATKYKHAIKATKDSTAESSGDGGRGASQVLACSLLSSLFSVLHATQCGKEGPIDFTSNILSSQLTCAILAHHATCLADTLASEMGILAKTSPILITQPWRRVPPGTNGGVTLEGTIWSAIGGAIIGLSTSIFDYMSGLDIPLLNNTFQLVTFGMACGLIGSIIDSLLGATLQQTYWDDNKKLIYHSNGRPESAKLLSGLNILSNEQVNFASLALTTTLAGWVIGPLIFA